MADLAEEAAQDLVRRAASAHRPAGNGLLGAYRSALDLVLRLKAELEARGESLGGEGVGASPPRAFGSLGGRTGGQPAPSATAKKTRHRWVDAGGTSRRCTRCQLVETWERGPQWGRIFTYRAAGRVLTGPGPITKVRVPPCPTAVPPPRPGDPPR